MTNNNLRMLLSSLLMLLETGHTDKAVEVLRNSIEYIDKNTAPDNNEKNDKNS